jgi:predicted nucleic acid-binding protein
MSNAMRIANQYSITAYDACYIALALSFNIPLVTADKKLVNTVPSIIWLGNLS